MPTQSLQSGVVTTLAANTAYAIPPGPYRILSTIALTSCATVGGVYASLTGASAEPGAYVSGGFVQAASIATVVIKKITIDRSYPSLIASDSPLAYWRLNESSGNTCYDSIGAIHLAKGSGVTIGSSASPGILPIANGDYVALFDGTANGELTTASGVNTWFGASALSFEAWIWNTVFAATHEMVISLGGVGLYLSFDTGRLAMSIHTGTQLVSKQLVSTAATDAWHHIAGTWVSGEQIRLYIDGAEVVGDNPVTRTGTLSSSTNVFIGCFGGSSLFYSGIISNVALYLRQLSATEVLDHYRARALTA